MLPPQPFHCAVLHPQPVYHSVMPRHAPLARQRLQRQSGGGRSAGRLCREVGNVYCRVTANLHGVRLVPPHFRMPLAVLRLVCLGTAGPARGFVPACGGGLQGA